MAFVTFCGNLDKDLNFEYEIIRNRSLELLQLLRDLSGDRLRQLSRQGFHAIGTACGVRCFSCGIVHQDMRATNDKGSLLSHHLSCLHTSGRCANNVSIAEYGEAHLMHDISEMRCEVCRHNHVNSIDVITGKLRHCDVCAGKHAIVLCDAGVRCNRIF